MIVVFDIGNVLVNWDAKAAFRHAFDQEAEIDAFLENISFSSWNLENDAGRGQDAAIAAVTAEHRDLVRSYFDNFHLAIERRIEGSWELLYALQRNDIRLFALTNWGPDTWPIGLKTHPELYDIFEDIVVSGYEKLIKPQREIYQLLCQRNGISPEDCFFIDDSLKNVQAAQAVGMAGHHFIDAERLRADLVERGLL